MKKFVLALLVVSMLFCSCARPMTGREKKLFAGMCVAQFADGWTTNRNIGAGAREQNPLVFADRPDTDTITLFTLGKIALFWGLGEISPDNREMFFTIPIMSGAGASLYNQYMYDKERP